MPTSRDPHTELVRRIETTSRLTDDERLSLKSLPFRVRMLDENQTIFREGNIATECCVIISGVACRYKIVAGGRRQIISFHFAGDMPDLQSLLLNKLDHSLAMLTRGEVAYIPHTAMRTIMAERPGLAVVLYRHTMVDASIFREWIANVGRRMALERVSHVICECFERMHAVGLVRDKSFELPITQNEIGDATGLSNVHINRTMQTLRKKGLMVSRGRVHTIPDWAKMREAADYDPAYLHLLAPLEL